MPKYTSHFLTNLFFPIVTGIILANLGVFGCVYFERTYVQAPCWLINFLMAFGLTAVCLDFLVYLVYPRIKGRQKKVNLRFEEFPQNMGFVPHLSLKLHNHELFDIENCYATLLELEHLYTPHSDPPDFRDCKSKQ